MSIYFVAYVASISNITVAGLNLSTNKYNFPSDWLLNQGLKEFNNRLTIRSIKFRILFDPEIAEKSDRLRDLFTDKSEVCIYDTVPSFVYDAPDQASKWMDLMASLYAPFKWEPRTNVSYPALYANAYNDVDLALKTIKYYEALYDQYKLVRHIKNLEKEISTCNSRLQSIVLPSLLPDLPGLEAEDEYGDYTKYYDYYND